MRRDAGERGATLVEMVISIAIIAIVVSGTLLLVQKVAVHSADPMVERQALAIAQAYLEEILLRPYWDPTLGSAGGACFTTTCATTAGSTTRARRTRRARP